MTRHAPRIRLADLYNAYDRLAFTPGAPVQIANIGAAVGGADMDTVIMMFRRAHQPMKVRVIPGGGVTIVLQHSTGWAGPPGRATP
jgi:hypothetical protein